MLWAVFTDQCLVSINSHTWTGPAINSFPLFFTVSVCHSILLFEHVHVQGSRKKKLWKVLRVVEFAVKIVDISNICTFFVNGVFPSLLYRILNIKTVRYMFIISFILTFFLHASYFSFSSLLHPPDAYLTSTSSNLILFNFILSYLISSLEVIFCLLSSSLIPWKIHLLPDTCRPSVIFGLVYGQHWRHTRLLARTAVRTIPPAIVADPIGERRKWCLSVIWCCRTWHHVTALLSALSCTLYNRRHNRAKYISHCSVLQCVISSHTVLYCIVLYCNVM